MISVLYLGPESHYLYVKGLLPDYLLFTANNETTTDRILRDINVIFDAYMKIPFPKERLIKCNNLKLFITATTGASHIDTLHLEERNIPLLTLKGQEHITKNITAAAEHSWLLLMAVARQLTAAVKETQGGGWDRNKFPGMMLRGKTIGIIGCGRIGQWMARYAIAFEMIVLGHDPYNKPNEDLFILTSIEELLRKSDFVSIHIPLNTSTKNLLSNDKIQILKKGCVLINSSRGEIIDEKALLKSLLSGDIGGVGLDVLTCEPYVENDPLIAYSREHNNLIITPHIGGFSPDALDIVLSFSCERIKEYFNE